LSPRDLTRLYDHTKLVRKRVYLIVEAKKLSRNFKIHKTKNKLEKNKDFYL